MQELSEDLNVTFGEMFAAIEYLENHTFSDNSEYFQSENLAIETEFGFDSIKGLIKKTAILLELKLSDGSIIRCADKHILFGKFGECFAKDLKAGDLVYTHTGFKAVEYSKLLSTNANVYDIEVDNLEHSYLTSNGVKHHNTLITAGLSQIYSSQGFRTITIVPSGDLVDQTAKWYINVGLDVGIYSGTEKDVDHANVVATWQSLQYNPSIIQDFDVFIWDEAHGVGAEVARKLINDHGKSIAFRFGVTGTFPKGEVDQYNLFSSIGPILIEVPAHWLIDHGYLAKLVIEPVEIKEVNVEENFVDYSAEKAFLSKSIPRMELIADLIISKCLQHGNTLVLVNSISFGKKLSALIKDSVFLYGESSSELRKEHYDMFDTRNDVIVIASSGIASTGISIDRIFCQMLIDPGKSFVKAIQSVGRGLRKGGDKHEVFVVDVYSDLKWAKKHHKERLKYYHEAKYPISEKQKIKVKS